jgi:hypothetical protein
VNELFGTEVAPLVRAEIARRDGASGRPHASVAEHYPGSVAEAEQTTPRGPTARAVTRSAPL